MIHLRTQHVFGRSQSADTVLEHLDASNLHASVRWCATHWELRDHSRNGTTVNGLKLSNAPGQALRLGSVIVFGQGGGTEWLVEDLSPPSTMLWPLRHDSTPIALGCSNLLPHDKAAELSIHLSQHGQWICTTPKGSWVLQDGDEVEFAKQTWCFFVNTEVTPTMDHITSAPRPSQPGPALHFTVSLDEEHVCLQLLDGERKLDLGERSHHYALLILSRLRLADAQRYPDIHAHGWVELKRLAKMLGMDPGHLNIQIFRMRKQLALAFPPGAPVPELIERRRGSLRLGSLRFRITRGTQLEAAFDPLGDETLTHRPEESLVI